MNWTEADADAEYWLLAAGLESLNAIPLSCFLFPLSCAAAAVEFGVFPQPGRDEKADGFRLLLLWLIRHSIIENCIDISPVS